MLPKSFILFVSIVFAICNLLPGCKKDPPRENPILKASFDPRGMEYIQLREGMRLIYKDSATGETDSVVVTKSRIGWGQYRSTQLIDYPDHDYQTFELELRKFPTGSDNNIWFAGQAFAGILNMGATSDMDTAFILLSEDYYTGSSKNTYYGSFIYNRFLPATTVVSQMEVEGVTYHDVIIGGIDNMLPPGTNGYTVRTCWWAKGVGIIKRRVIDNAGVVTHTLLRHH